MTQIKNATKQNTCPPTSGQNNRDPITLHAKDTMLFVCSKIWNQVTGIASFSKILQHFLLWYYIRGWTLLLNKFQDQAGYSNLKQTLIYSSIKHTYSERGDFNVKISLRAIKINKINIRNLCVNKNT